MPNPIVGLFSVFIFCLCTLFNSANAMWCDDVDIFDDCRQLINGGFGYTEVYDPSLCAEGAWTDYDDSGNITINAICPEGSVVESNVIAYCCSKFDYNSCMAWYRGEQKCLTDDTDPPDINRTPICPLGYWSDPDAVTDDENNCVTCPNPGDDIYYEGEGYLIDYPWDFDETKYLPEPFVLTNRDADENPDAVTKCYIRGDAIQNSKTREMNDGTGVFHFTQNCYFSDN